MGERVIQGEFEHHVLLAVARLRAEAFTAAVVLELERRTGRAVSPSAVYVSLRRLEAKELVHSDLVSSTAPGALRERRFFRVTEPGLAALREAREDLERLWEGMDPLLVRGDG